MSTKPSNGCCPDEMLTLDWAEADIPIIKGYLEGRDKGAKK